MKKILVTAVVLAGLASGARAYTLDEVLGHLKEKEASTKAVRFSFGQRVEFKGTTIDASTEGTALFSKDRFRIEQKKPRQQISISDGNKMWVYNPAYKQVWTGSKSSWINSAAIPKGLVPVGAYVTELEKNFVLSVGSSTDNTVRIDAIPKSADDSYQLQLTISTTDWVPVSTHFVSASAEVNTTLTDFEINPVVPDSQFKFAVPKGVDTIPF